MEGFSSKQDINNHDFSQAGQFSTKSPELGQLVRNSSGSFFRDANIRDALKQALGVSVDGVQPAAQSTSAASAPSLTVQTAAAPNDHDHAPAGAGNFEFHVDSLDQVAVAKTLSKNAIGKTGSLKDAVGSKGDLLLPGGGNNTVIGSGDSDIIVGTGRGFNTITTGGGKDTIVLGQETTNRIFDFDPTKDKFALAPGVNADNIMIAQGKNPNKGGLGQPLDSLNNTLIIDKSTNHILASLSFNKAANFSASQFSQLNPLSIFSLAQVSFKVQAGDGKLTGSGQHDLMIGKGGNDFLYVGDDGFKIGTAKGTGPQEFPFPNPSPGSAESTATLKNGVLNFTGSYKNFEGAPLFSQGEKVIDPKATILNGSDPVALINGFLKVPNDVQGNKISGTHLHFSPSEDSRGNNADATVIRYLSETVNPDKKSGTISGNFTLNPDEQAAFLAGNIYMNIHSNVDLDGDGKAGFPTGEVRMNFNQNVVQLT
jgi:CHRD domain